MNSKDEFKAFWDVVKYIAPLIGSVLGKYMGMVGDAAEVVITVIAKVLGALKPLLNTAIDGINLIIRGYNLIQTGKDIPPIPKIGAASTATGALGNYSMSTGTVQTSPTTTTPSGTTTTTPTGTTTTSGIAGAVASAAAAANNIVSGNFNPGSFRMAEAASMGTTINLTVTGAFEPEGTARTIIDTLNNSYYRGTGGATNLQIA
jgi:phage-related protein